MRSAKERELRGKLGIPDDAETVLIFGETSHWDPNWLYTSDEYYDKRIRSILGRALDELEAEPRRVFSVECVHFLRLYWERQSADRARLRRAINDGQMRLTATGFTTPDTLLPATEALIRDYHLGQLWLHERGLTVEPTVAYLPDNFGYSPGLPAVLNALGFDRTAITRIDGMHFAGCDYRLPSAYPLPGSSADDLKRAGSDAFIWEGPDGDSSVLCHWNAHTYFFGDMLAASGVIRWMGRTFGFNRRDERHIARRIHQYVAKLKSQALSPYLFCPIGCDFNDPIPGLYQLLDRYNAHRYPQTGIWVANAGIDDYLAFVDCHRDRLPRFQLDSNPYWMGFYVTRPGVKVRTNRLNHRLMALETVGAAQQIERSANGQASCAQADKAHERLADAWRIAVLSNHHDFVTGTSPDRVYFGEQSEWLAQSERAAEQSHHLLSRYAPAVKRWSADEAIDWGYRGRELFVHTPHFSLTFCQDRGGCLTSLRATADDRELLDGPANDLVAYRDSGGLWRMGHEFVGGVFRCRDRLSRRKVSISVEGTKHRLKLFSLAALDGVPVERTVTIHADSPVIEMRLRGRARRYRTVTVAFPTAVHSDSLTMDVAGGVVVRPAEKLYRPTFWAARSFVHLRDAERGVCAVFGGPGCVAQTAPGTLELAALRYAPKERAFGILPILAHPAAGHDRNEHTFDYALFVCGVGDYRELALPQRANALLDEFFAPDIPAAAVLADVLEVLGDSVVVRACKRADRGAGIIVRLERLHHRVTPATLRLRKGRLIEAWTCDARERDEQRLFSDGQAVALKLRQPLTSVRLVVGATQAAS
ncbi:MAG: hypothetical protein H6707_21760 [Deltaproteobacteria bacterium]|nr:hypothetical protein [Deltaproteobacteria bacterium]